MPAAHAQHRHPAIQRPRHQLELEGVALGLGRREQRVGLLAVAARLDVATGGEHERVDRVERRPIASASWGSVTGIPPASSSGRCTPMPP